MNRQIKIILIFIIGLIVSGGLLWVVYQLGQNKQSEIVEKSLSKLSPTPSVTPQSLKKEDYPKKAKHLTPPSNWKEYRSNLLGLSFFYPSVFKVQDNSNNIILYVPNSPARWSITKYYNYNGGSRRQWYLKNHSEISPADLQFEELKTNNFTGLLVTYLGAGYGHGNMSLLIPRQGKMIVASANGSKEDNLTFFNSIRFY